MNWYITSANLSFWGIVRHYMAYLPWSIVSSDSLSRSHLPLWIPRLPWLHDSRPIHFPAPLEAPAIDHPAGPWRQVETRSGKGETVNFQTFCDQCHNPPKKTCLLCIWWTRHINLSISHNVFICACRSHMTHMWKNHTMVWEQLAWNQVEPCNAQTSSQVAWLACCNAWPSSRKAAATTSWALHVAVFRPCSKGRILRLPQWNYNLYRCGTHLPL